MGGALVFVESSNPTKAKKYPHIWWLLCKGDLNTFIKNCKGSDKRLMNRMVHYLDKGAYKIHGVQFEFTSEIITQAIKLPN